jgi:hypothetical protein
MFLALEVIADAGVIAVPFQAIMGAVFSICLVGVVYLVGLLLRIQAFARVWYSSVHPAAAIIVLALAFYSSARVSASSRLSFHPRPTRHSRRFIRRRLRFGFRRSVRRAALSYGSRVPSTDDRNG